MSGVESRRIADGDQDMRLDRWLRRAYPGLTQGRVEKLLRTGQIRVDGCRVKSAHRVVVGQTVRVPPLGLEAAGAVVTGSASGKLPARTPAPAPARQSGAARERDAAAIKAMILFKDDDVIVLNKPAGLAVQGGTGVSQSVDSMLESLGVDGEKPRLVHRLDRDTAGVLVLARTAAAARKLTSMFRGRSVRKIYWALTSGIPEAAAGVIDAPLGKSGGSREKMEIDEEDGRRAVTLFRTLDHAGKVVAWLALWPRTGRTHQIRAHCAAIGAPVLGDGKYGGRDAFIDADGLSRQVHLLARRIVVPHPSGRGSIDVTAPLPAHMATAFGSFGFDYRDAPSDPFPDEK